MIELNKIYNDDCISFLSRCPDKFFDAVITDPPYKQEAHGRGLATKRKIYKEMSKYTSLDNDWYNENILNELVRVCKFPNVFLFCGKRDVIKILNYCEKNKYEYHILQVCKKNPTPFTNNTWLSSEYAIHVTDRKIVYSKEYKVKIPYFLTGNEKETSHPNEKNINDIMRIVKNITNENDAVLDCFSGSGTTAIACNRLGRKFVCVEKDKDYWQASVKRLEDERKQLTLF